MKEFWLFFTQQYLQWMQANLNLVMNLSKVEGFLFGYGSFKTITGRFHWGGSNLEWDCWNPDCTKAKNQPWLLQALYSKPYALRLLPLLLHWNCSCQSSKSSLQIPLLLSPNMVDGFPLKHCLHFACRSSLNFPATLSFTLLFLTSEQWHTPELSPQTFCLFYLH